jgi:hypothetical protein
MDGQSDQSAIDASDLQDPAILNAINGPPGVGPGTFYSQPDGSGGFVAPDVSSSVGGFFASVPWWAWAALGGVVLLRVMR